LHDRILAAVVEWVYMRRETYRAVRETAIRMPSRERGVTYVCVLLVVAFAGVGLAAIGELASTAEKREREAELLFIGNQFREAIGMYDDVYSGTSVDSVSCVDGVDGFGSLSTRQRVNVVPGKPGLRKNKPAKMERQRAAA
jgi:hypothetical protein